MYFDRARVVLIFLALLSLPFSALADVQITGMTDFNFGTWISGTQNIENTGLCVCDDTGATRYLVTGSGSGGGGAFEVSSGGGDTMEYRVFFQGGTGGFNRLFPGIQETRNNPSPLANCGGVPNAAMRIRFVNAVLNTAIPGNYSGTVTILIEPF